MKFINIITKKLIAISCQLSAFRNLKPKTYNLKPTKGFTLVEMLVAVATFMVVMLIATGSLVSIIDGSNKAQSLKSAINNLNFALESMGKNIRVGTNYSVNDCLSVNTCLSFTSYKDSASDGNDFIVYRFNNESIERCVKPNSIYTISSCSDADYIRMTAQEVKITYMFFDVDTNKPSRVLITISGEAGNKERLKTKFNLQTTVAQRTIQ